MSRVIASPSPLFAPSASSDHTGLQRLAAEVRGFVGAVLQPGRLIAEVEQMRALQVEADRIESAQPVRAELLRRQAQQLCLR